MRGIAEPPAAMLINSGTFASAVKGAIAAATGDRMTPVSNCTCSRVISSCASRLPTSGLAVSSRRRISIFTSGGRSFSCSFR